jgi:catechol 2,3-dioxygenase-like lactoylglutathione lyase family enzyme
MNRRDLLLSVGAVMAAPARSALMRAQSRGAPAIHVRSLNHVHLVVSNLQRSLEFYQRVFGLPLAGMQGVEADWNKRVIPMLAIGAGPQFISFNEGPGRASGRDRIDHFGFGVNGFDAQRVIRMLAAHEIKGTIRMRADADPAVAELKYTDPDNIIVQIKTGTPTMPFDGFFHFRSSMISGSASLIRLRMRAKVSSRQSACT